MKNKALDSLSSLIERAPDNQKEKIRLSVITVTPELAERFLSVNYANRKVSLSNVLYWKTAITGNAVPLTHQGIAITGTIENPKRMIDGQHRCLAIIETGRSVDFVVSEYTPEEAYSCVDHGMKRSLADRAGIPSDEAQMCNSLFYMSINSKQAKPPVKLIQDMHQVIFPYMRHVVNKRRRSLSVVPIRLAFLLQQKAYKTNYSEEFQEGKFGILPESMNALYRRQSTRPFPTGGGMAQMALFCATWRAITRPSNTKIHMPSSPSEDAREIIYAVFPEVRQLLQDYRMIK